MYILDPSELSTLTDSGDRANPGDSINLVSWQPEVTGYIFIRG